MLLVEDSKILQRSVATALRKSGYAVDVTGDGYKGLWYGEQHSYDVIILDLILPGLDGLTILELLRRRRLAGGKKFPPPSSYRNAIRAKLRTC